MDIQKILAYEIKKEIADRYFGFRKLIEEDKLDFAQKVKRQSFILEKRISFDLIRIYVLLKDDSLIHEFLKLTGIEGDLFYDPHLTTSPNIRERVFEGLHIHGITQNGRFKNLFFDCYERLGEHVNMYREKIEELREEQEFINEEIEAFYQQNDLGTIMGFLKKLASTEARGVLQGGMESGMTADLEKKLQIEPQLPIEHYLPILPPLPEIQTIRFELQQLVDHALDLQDDEFMEDFIDRAAWVLR